MNKRLLTLTLAAVVMTLAGWSPDLAKAQVPSTTAGASRVSQQHVIGVVTAIDQAANQITVKPDAGGSVTITVNAQTTYRRMPPGQTSLAQAETITSADVKVGDRVLVPGGAALTTGVAARQVIVMAREAVAARREQQRDDWRTRGVNGRVLSIDAAKKEISIESRTRDSAQTLTVVANNARIRRYAPGSLRPDDAVAGTFSDIRVGDQMRVLGNREEFKVTAEEIISGTVSRMLGTLEKVDAARNEIVIKDTQTGKSTVVALLPATTLRRVPADFAETLARGPQRRGTRENENMTEAQRAAQREQREARRRERETQGAPATAPPAGQDANSPRRAGGPGGPGGRNPQQMLENFPVITAAELKKGDAIMVTGTGTNDASRVIAATVVTGNAEILQLLQRRTGGRPEGMSPGLPSGVMGGGTGGDPDRPQPATPPRQQ